MGSSDSSLKVFLRSRDGKDQEARCFTVDAITAASYELMIKKLVTVFPSLQDTSFKFTWKDTDNDEITIATEEELLVAFHQMGKIKTFYVTVTGVSKPH